jgi:hypothetical protein
MARPLLDKTGRSIFPRDALTAFKVIYFFRTPKVSSNIDIIVYAIMVSEVVARAKIDLKKKLIIKMNSELLEGQDPDGF